MEKLNAIIIMLDGQEDIVCDVVTINPTENLLVLILVSGETIVYNLKNIKKYSFKAVE